MSIDKLIRQIYKEKGVAKPPSFKVICTKLKPEQAEKLDEIAKQQGLTRSGLVRKLLLEYIRGVGD